MAVMPWAYLLAQGSATIVSASINGPSTQEQSQAQLYFRDDSQAPKDRNDIMQHAIERIAAGRAATP